MRRFTDSKGNNIEVDSANNLFKNGKCINQKSRDVFFGEVSVSEHTEQYLGQEDIKPLSLVVGHVPKFEYGYGENKVVVNTGLHKW